VILFTFFRVGVDYGFTVGNNDFTTTENPMPTTNPAADTIICNAFDAIGAVSAAWRARDDRQLGRAALAVSWVDVVVAFELAEDAVVAATATAPWAGRDEEIAELVRSYERMAADIQAATARRMRAGYDC